METALAFSTTYAAIMAWPLNNPEAFEDDYGSDWEYYIERQVEVIAQELSALIPAGN